MRITFRAQTSRAYWENRWASLPEDKVMLNASIYPLLYARLIIKAKEGRILEAGCGNGRILNYYESNGYQIFGFDFIKTSVKKIIKNSQSAKVITADVRRLPYPDNSFKYVLAFGLLHNLNAELWDATRELYRVTESNGTICVSFRADNLQTRANDYIESIRYRLGRGLLSKGPEKHFHKINLTKKELEHLLTCAGFSVDRIYPAENMPLFYKFSVFRSKEHKQFNETRARSEGYQLSFVGNILQKLMIKLFPHGFCNINVAIATKSS